MCVDTLLKKKKEMTWFYYPGDAPRRYPKKNIFAEYCDLLKVSSCKNNVKLRSCEQELVELDNKDLKDFLQQYVVTPSLSKETCEIHKSCVLLHLIQVFCIPDQEEKKELVQNYLKEWLHILSNEMRYIIFKRYITQQLKTKSILTEIDLLAGQIDQQHEFMLKLCYLDTLCVENNHEGFKELLQQNADFFVSKIEEVVTKFQMTSSKYEKTKVIFCMISLSILNWKLYNQKTASTSLTLKNTETQDYPLVTFKPIKYLCTEHKVKSILQSLLSTLHADETLTAFNAYFDQMYAMKSEITEDGLCISETESHYEFLLKLCYWMTICKKNDYEAYKKIIHRFPGVLVSDIEENVQQYEPKTKLYICKTLLCILNWHICTLKTAQLLVQNTEIQASQSVAIVDDSPTKTIRRILKTVLLTLSEDEIFTAFNEYLDQILTRKSEITEDDFCTGNIEPYHEFLMKLCYCEKLCNEYIDFCNLLEELFTDSMHERKAFDLLIEAFKDYNTYPCYGNQNKYCLRDFTEEQDARKQEDSCKGEPKAMHISCHTRNGLFTEYSSLMLENSGYSEIRMLQPYLSTRSRGNFFNERDDINTDHSGSPLMLEHYSFTRSKTNFFNIWDDINTEYSRSPLIFVPDPFTRWEGNFSNELNDKYNAIKIKDIFVNMLALIMMVCMVWTSAGHHSSAKQEKYLTLKHHYPMASLYLLWCSGDIEVHPGPYNEKKPMVHNSSIKRRWIPNVCKILDTKLSDKVKLKYRGKKGRISDEKYSNYLEEMLNACLEEKVHVPKMFQAEINAWETNECKLLNKLFVCRKKIDKIKASLHDFFTCGGSTKDLTDINVSIITELKANEIAMVLWKDQRPEDISQMVAHITRYIAGISIKCAHGKDLDTKCDGLWKLPLKDWPTDIQLFDPNNRGKYRKKSSKKELISDFELVDILLKLTEKKIPPKYNDLVGAFKTMRNGIKEKSINKQHKADLCSTFKRITSLDKLDSALKNLWENGIFTEEVHNNLSKWWTTRPVKTGDDQKLSQKIIDAGEKIAQPHISINISTTFISITVDPTTESSSHVKYDFPFNDDLVPLKTMATAINQITTQLPSSDVKTPDANPVDNQTDSITTPQEAMDIHNSFISVDHFGHVTLKSEIKLQCKTSTQDPASSSMTYLDQFSQSKTQTAVSGQLVTITSASDQSTTYADNLGNSTLNATNVSQNQSSFMGFRDSIAFITSEVVLNSGHQFNTVMNGNQLLLTDSDNSSDNGSNTWNKPTIGSKRKRRKSIEGDIDGDQLRDSKKSLLSTQMKETKKPVFRPVNKQTETDQNQIVPLVDNSTMVNSNMNWLPDYQSIDFDTFNLPYLSADEILTWI